jgi:hypothetical protein
MMGRKNMNNINKNIINSISLSLLMIMFCTSAINASDNAGAFIEKGLSARASAMGMSYVSSAKNSDAVYWNPAGLADSDSSYEIIGMGTRAFETQYTSIQGSFGLLGLNWGLAYVGAGIDGIEETVENINTGRGQGTGNNLSYDAVAYYMSTAKKITNDIFLGITAKYIQEREAGYTANGAGLDVGAIYKPVDWISFGTNLQNLIAPSMEWNTPSKNVDRIPLNIKTGVSFSLLNDSLIAGADLNFRNNRTTKLSLGAEYWLNPNLALRGGFDHGELCLGTGLYLAGFILDFSWINPRLDIVEDVYRVSIGYRFENN